MGLVCGAEAGMIHTDLPGLQPRNHGRDDGITCGGDVHAYDGAVELHEDRHSVLI